MARKKKSPKDGFNVKGFFRITIDEAGKIVGDSGMFPNTVGNLGLEQYAAYLLGASAGSKQLAYFALGSGGSMATDGTATPSEVLQASKRASISAKSFSSRTVSNGSATLWLYGQFNSTDSFVNNSFNISNIGIGNSISGGTLFCAQTYASSQVSTNQHVNVTYQIQIG